MDDDSRSEILAVLREQEDAIRRADAKAALASLAPDVVMYDLPPPLEQKGDAAEAAAALERWFDSWQGPVSVEVKDPDILVDGDLAVAFGLSRMKGTKKEGNSVHSWNRRTIVLRRSNGAGASSMSTVHTRWKWMAAVALRRI